MLHNDINGILKGVCSRSTTRQARESTTDMICIVFVQSQKFSLFFQTIGIAFAFISQYIFGVDLNICRRETTNNILVGWIDKQVDSMVMRQCSINIF